MYHCPKCFSNNTERAVLITSHEELILEHHGIKYNRKEHGNPFKCNECGQVFAVGIDKIPYIEHCQKAVEE